METKLATVDDLAGELDLRGEPWNLYRLALGGWAVHLGNGREDPANRVVPKVEVGKGGAPTILEALQAAVNSPRLPVIPKCPQVLYHEEFEVKKRGNSWWIYRNGLPSTGHIATKREALERITTAVQRARAARDAWDAEHAAFVGVHTAGEHFYWKDNL